MKPRNMVETIDGEEHTYADTLWIPSATDIFGPSESGFWAEEPDSEQLEIFKTERGRVKEVEATGLIRTGSVPRLRATPTVSCVWAP